METKETTINMTESVPHLQKKWFVTQPHKTDPLLKSAI